jgi:hypothetical protein
MKAITLFVLLVSAACGASSGQVSQAPVGDVSRLLDTSSCAGNFQSGKVVCEVVLPRLVDAKNDKSGDHIILRANVTTSTVEEPIITLDATIIEVQSGVNGNSVMRIRIDKAMRKDGREIPVEARIVALASQSSVTEGWQFPAVIVDRFPRIPEDDQRLPGEKKLSEDQAHTSPLDSMPDIPVHHRVVCLNKKKKASANPCTNLLEAWGVYGYKNVTLEPLDPALPAESVLTSKKNMAFRAGTVLVLEVGNIPRPIGE